MPFLEVGSPESGRDETEVVKSFEDKSHLVRALLRCRDCGQLYFYEWCEEIDWVNGDDPRYQAWVLVDEQDVDGLLKADIWTVRTYTPRIINDSGQGRNQEKRMDKRMKKSGCGSSHVCC